MDNADDKLARATGINRMISFSCGAAGPLIGGFLFQECRFQGGLTCLFIGALIPATYAFIALRD